MSDEKILVTDENNLGYSYYIADDEDDDLYYGDGYYYDPSTGRIIDNYYDNSYYTGNNYNSDYYYDDYSDRYYYPSYYGNRYDRLYSGDGYYYDPYTGRIVDRYYYDDDYYDRRYRNRDSDRNNLSIHGDTLRVGSNYSNNIWLKDATGDYGNVRIIDDKDNSKNLFIQGNSRQNSILSGSGQTTLAGGGGGQNTLVGGSKRNIFWYEGNSRDVAVSFGTGDSDNSDVVVLSNVKYSSINRDGSSITFNMADGNYMQLQTDGASYDDDPIWFSGNGSTLLRYKIAQNTSSSLNYRDDVNLFYFNNPGQIMVSGSNHNIWIGGDTGQYFNNVSTINAGASSGYNTLMGNTAANVIIGGSGVSTLWGGTGTANDTLIGGTGPENFRVGKSEGYDFIYTNEGHDVINLYDTNLSDITYADVQGDRVTIGFNTGFNMTVYNNANVTPIFQVAGGARYNYHRDSRQWQGA